MGPAVRAALVALGGLLAGCATPPTLGVDRLSGRLSLRIEGQPERSVSAGFELSGHSQAGELLLTTPLGTTAAEARWLPGSVTLRTGGERRTYANLDQLSAEVLGEPLPLAALFDWLRGRPWPQATSTPRTDGQPGFDQLGWRIDLARWQEHWVEMRRAAPPAVTLRARLDTAD